MIYNLYCAKDRSYTMHKVEDDEKGEIQKITCLFCGHVQEYVILDRRVAVAKEIYQEYKNHER